MQTKLLKSIVSDIAGKQAVEIVDLLAGKKDVNEFLIAKKLKLTINQTRNILYKLADAGLVSFIRKKDKRKGWYIYFWTLNSLKSLELLENRFLAEIARLENLLKNRQTRRFYVCNTCNVEVGEETALINEFICQECGEVYNLATNENIIKELEGNISRIKKHLETIKDEKNKEIEVQNKKKASKSKRAKKKSGKRAKKKTRKKVKKLKKKSGKKKASRKKHKKKAKRKKR